jgi:uroporphyrinogen decarboxylase
MDYREYIDVDYGMRPPFEYELLEKTDKYEVFRDAKGQVHRALIEGAVGGGRMCMDTYLSFPVTDKESFRELKKRYVAHLEERYPPNWRKERAPKWRERDHVLVLARNCVMLGFYWRAREWMGTENLTYAWAMQPDLMHEMMEFIADFTIEVSKPILEEVNPDYIFINEDMAMKTGPLISPDLYDEFILPNMKRVVDFHKKHGVRWVVVDTDGDPDPLIPSLMDAGVDALWPFEQASDDTNPHEVRAKYGKDLRIWGCVDKRELAKDKKAIDDHLASMRPLIEEGGFIPTVDHTVPPDVPLDNFQHYMERKQQLLRGETWS